jgi:hypothetical protein
MMGRMRGSREFAMMDDGRWPWVDGGAGWGFDHCRRVGGPRSGGGAGVDEWLGQWKRAVEEGSGRGQWKRAVEEGSGRGQWKRAVEEGSGRGQVMTAVVAEVVKIDPRQAAEMLAGMDAVGRGRAYQAVAEPYGAQDLVRRMLGWSRCPLRSRRRRLLHRSADFLTPTLSWRCSSSIACRMVTPRIN